MPNRTNLTLNPSFESNPGAGIVGSFGTMTGLTYDVQATDRVRSGTKSLRVSATSSGQYYMALFSWQLQAGKTYTLSAYVYPDAASSIWGVLLAFRDTGYGFLTPYQPYNVTPGQWTRVSVTYTPPSDIEVFLNVSDYFGTTSTPYSIWIDDILLEESGTTNPYFSGSTNAPGKTYAWLGTPDASQSMEADANIPGTVPHANLLTLGMG